MYMMLVASLTLVTVVVMVFTRTSTVTGCVHVCLVVVH